MTSTLKPYKLGTHDWSNPNIRFIEAKKHLEAGTYAFIEKDLKEITEYIEEIRQGIISSQDQIVEFINEDLGFVIQIILSKNLRFLSEQPGLAKIQPFIYQTICFCLELLPDNIPGVFEILQMLLLQTQNYYSYNNLYSPREVVEELFRKYPLVFSICALTKSIHDEGAIVSNSTYETEMQRALSGYNPDSDVLPVKAAKSVRFPGKIFVKSSCIYQKISIIYLINLNYFIQIGGLEAIASHMHTLTATTGLLPSINILNNMNSFLEEDFYHEEVLPLLMKAIKSLSATLNEEEIKLAKKEDIVSLFQVLKNVFENAKDQSSASEMLSNYELDILLLCLKGQYMEKRIFAITTLVEKISEAERNQEEYDGLRKHVESSEEKQEETGSDSVPKTMPVMNWFIKDNYLRWIEDHQILNVLLGESAHAEVLRRSTALFRFLFRNNKVSLEKVNTICDLAIEKHDTYRKHILNILADLAELMDIDQLRYLFEKIKSFPNQEMDHDILQLIKTIGINSTGKVGDADPERDVGPLTKEQAGHFKKDDPHSYKIVINDEETKESEGNRANNENMESLMTTEDIARHNETKEKGTNVVREIVDFLWKIILEGKGAKGSNQQLVTGATDIMKNLISDKLEKDRIYHIEKAVVAISQNVAVAESFRVVQSIIQSKYPIQKQNGTFLASKRDLILHLESQFSITNTLFNSLVNLKADLVSYYIESYGLSTSVQLGNEPGTETNVEASQKGDRSRLNVQTEPETLRVSPAPNQADDLRSPVDGPNKNRKGRLNPTAGPMGGQSNEEMFKSYLREVEDRVNFVRMLKSNSRESFRVRHAKLLWDILVENALYEAERDIFFSLFNSIIYCSQDDTKLIDEETINYVFFDLLMTIDFSCYTLNIFYCFEELFKYFNKYCNLIKVDYRDFKVKSLDLVGLGFLWELYLNCSDMKVVAKAQQLLLRISTHLADKSQRICLINTCINLIEKTHQTFKDNPTLSPDSNSTQRISRSLDFISDFLQEYGELHIQKGSHKPNDSIQVKISNQLPGAQAPKKFDLILFKTMTVKEAKALIASKLSPQVAPKEIVLISRGSIIGEEEMVLDDLPVKIQNEQTIMCTKNSTADDAEMQAIPLMGPIALPPSTTDEDSSDVWQKIESIQAFLPGLDVDFVKYVLKKKNYNVDEAASNLLDPDLQDFFRTQFESEIRDAFTQEISTNKNQEVGSVAPKAPEISMSQTLSNDGKTLDLFFGLLSLHIAEIEGKVWSLLMNLPLNTAIYEQIQGIFGPQDEGVDDSYEKIVSQDVDWPSVLDLESTPKLLYCLQIVNSLVGCDVLKSDDPERWQKARWRYNFLENNGFAYLLGLMLKYSESILIKQTDLTERLHNTEAKALRLILNLLKMYIHSALLATSSKAQQSLLLEIIDFPKPMNDPKPDKKSPQKAKARPSTPTFGSPGRNPSTNSPNKADNNFGDLEAGTNNMEKYDYNAEGAADVAGSSGPSNAKNALDEAASTQPTQISEFEELVKAMSEKSNNGLLGKALQYFNLKDLITKVLNIIKVSLDAIDKDKDLASVVETSFVFILPCFVAYPRLLRSMYTYPGTEYILKTIFFETQQESVRTKLTHLISFLSLRFGQIIESELYLIAPEQISKVGAETNNSSADDSSTKNSSSVHDTEATMDQGVSDADYKVVLKPPQDFFLRSLLPLVYSCETSTSINLEYFEMVSNLIHISDREAISTITNLSRLYAFALRFIIDRPILEDRSSEVEDKILSGFLLLAHTLVKVEPSLQDLVREKENPIVQEFSLQNVDLLQELYDFLFYLPTENEKAGASLGPPKCKHKRTRLHVFNLLRVLCDNNNQNLKKALDLLMQNHKKLPGFVMEGPSSEASMINSELKNTTGYVGLKNLGCTCYMNSLVQHFFMTTPLRNALLNSEVTVKLRNTNQVPASDEQEVMEGEATEDKKVFLSQISRETFELEKKEIQAQLNDNVLYQLQVLLAHLAESASEYVYPQHFFNSVKTINGERIVLNVQQDVNEFFNTLCDKLDMCMKDTPQQKVLPDLIGGLLSHEIISLEKDYPYYTEREEAYLTIPLDIKNKRDLSEALNLFIKEDILEGDNKYFCEKYDRKIKVMKRCCIKTLPNTLTITLKRFDFDFSQMQKVKINDYFEFPFSFDIKPWTIVGLKDQIPPEANYEPAEHSESYYYYELVGVLVHSGTAEGGHYYSFIKDRSGESKGWFEFNDNKVRPFDVNNIRTECFGAEGEKTGSIYDDFDLTYIKSAYILFYERSEPEASESLLKYQHVGVSETLSQAIWTENLELLRTKYFYNLDYFNFMMDLVKFYDFPTVKTVPKEYSELPSTVENEPIDVQEDGRGHVREKAVVESVGHTQDEKELYWEHTQIIELAITLASEMYVKNKDADGFARWMNMVESIIEKFVPGAIWLIKFVTSNPDFLRLIYIDDVSSTVREATRNLVSKAIDEAHVTEGSYLDEEQVVQTSTDTSSIAKTVKRSSLMRFLHSLAQQFSLDSETDYTAPQDQITLLITMTKLNALVAHFFVNSGLHTTYFTVFVQIQKLLNVSTNPVTAARDKERYKPSNVVLIFQAFETLFRTCITDVMYQTRSLAPTYLFTTPVDWEQCPRILPKMIKDIQDYEIFKKCMLPMQEKCDNCIQILQHIVWEDFAVSKKVICALVGQACSIIAEHREVDENLKIVYNICKLEDKFQEMRVKCVFSKEPAESVSYSRDEDLISSMKKAKDTYAKAHAVLALRWIAKIVSEIPIARDYALRYAEKFEWIVEFLYDTKTSKYPIYYSSADSELKAKLPHYVSKAYELLIEILPIYAKVEKEEEKEEPETKSNIEGLLKLSEEVNFDAQAQDDTAPEPENEPPSLTDIPTNL